MHRPKKRPMPKPGIEIPCFRRDAMLASPTRFVILKERTAKVQGRSEMCFIRCEAIIDYVVGNIFSRFFVFGHRIIFNSKSNGKNNHLWRNGC